MKDIKYKYYELTFGTQDITEKRLIHFTHIVKVTNKDQYRKWIKDILKEGYKTIDKSDLQVSRKIYELKDHITVGNQSGDLFVIQGYTRKDEIIDLIWVEVLESNEYEFNKPCYDFDPVELA